jgi:hypothetical protein
MAELRCGAGRRMLAGRLFRRGARVIFEQRAVAVDSLLSSSLSHLSFPSPRSHRVFDSSRRSFAVAQAAECWPGGCFVEVRAPFSSNAPWLLMLLLSLSRSHLYFKCPRSPRIFESSCFSFTVTLGVEFWPGVYFGKVRPVVHC